MKHLTFLVLILVVALLVVGCNGKGKDTALVAPQSGDNTGTTGTGSAAGDTGGSAPATSGTEGSAMIPGTSGTVGSGSSATGMAPTENRSIDASGEIIKHAEGKQPPAGRVWCENCKGHLPKEDAVTSADGKTYCMACAEELKIKK